MTEFLSSVGNALSSLTTRAFNWFIVRDYSYLQHRMIGMAWRPPQINWSISLFRIFTVIIIPIVGIVVVVAIKIRTMRKRAKALLKNGSAVPSDENEQNPAVPPN